MTLPAPFARFVAPAQARAHLWRIPLALAVVAACHGLMLAALTGTLRLLHGPEGAATLARIARGDSPGAVVVLLASFAGLFLGIALAVRLVHGRGFGTLIGRGAVALRHFVLGLGLFGALYALGLPLFRLATLVVPGLEALEVWPGIPPLLWLAWLIPALLVLAIQTGTEELIFRGYLQQQLAARFASPVIWALLPSAAFGLLHYDPAMAGANVWLIVGVTGLFGLIAADLTARSGTLGLAWGLHFANNFVALALIAPLGNLGGLALFRVPFGMDDTGPMRLALAADVVILVGAWVLARIWLARSRDTA